ncbi:hypothetical protein DL764_000815 [Monosporascus ibericus]|uniref:Nuclear transport factor 2 n=1 Tax=Monosporascus ibericus TaxID=155417 RepID=A0A4Q4TUH8_9PEZI|nr:hypothetical protein DL764_000815 [Monosporascus ibericus]
MAANFQAVADEFVTFYYAQFDADRNSLSALYRENSMLTFETHAVMGTANIVQKLVELPFQKVKHQVDTRDAQPGISGGILVLVTGKLLVDDQEQPMNYTQVFHLLPEGNSFFVYNDIFKLVYG